MRELKYYKIQKKNDGEAIVKSVKVNYRLNLSIEVVCAIKHIIFCGTAD